MRKVILLTAMPKESVWSSSIYVNGGSKVTFCVKHNLISTFFNFVFYCTLVFIMCFLTAGNICAQGTLPFDDGQGHPYGFNYSKTENGTGTVVEFHDDGTKDGQGGAGYYIGFSCVGGTSWAYPYSEGQTHTFTVTLNNNYSENDAVVGKLYIVALSCEITDVNVPYTSNIIKQACIDPLDNNTNNVLTLEVNVPYAAVYLYKENRIKDWEKVNIASVTRTVETSVVISESANNNITEINNKTVTLYRTLVADTWNTICLPFAPTPTQANTIFGEGAKFAEFYNVSNGVMQFRSVDVGGLVAGMPYLVLPTKSQTASSPIKLTDVTIPTTALSAGEVPIDGYTFKGIYSPTRFTKDDQSIRFVAAKNKLKYPNTENPLKALRAYFTVPVSGGPGSQTQNAKDYTFAVDSFVPTSIANIQIEGDGDGAIYNIGGQRVEGKSLPKGIYIRDGKKFVVK